MAVNGNELIVETTQTDDHVISLFALSEALGLILFLDFLNRQRLTNL